MFRKFDIFGRFCLIRAQRVRATIDPILNCYWFTRSTMLWLLWHGYTRFHSGMTLVELLQKHADKTCKTKGFAKLNFQNQALPLVM